jgi:hypothetical protein
VDIVVAILFFPQREILFLPVEQALPPEDHIGCKMDVLLVGDNWETMLTLPL